MRISHWHAINAVQVYIANTPLPKGDLRFQPKTVVGLIRVTSSIFRSQQWHFQLVQKMRVILFLSLFAFTSSQTCPVPPPEDVIYQPVGSGSDNFDPVSFDSRGLEPYYNMANGFSDIVRSGSLPYSKFVIGQHYYVYTRRVTV